MVWLDKFKLNKGLARTLTEAGYLYPKEIQLKTLSRIIGGQDVVAIAPEGSGKTSTYIISVLNRIRQGYDDAPRVLILVPNKDKVLAVIEQFHLLNKNSSIKIIGLFVAPGIEAQLDALADGADIVVATPDRARAIYLKLALNLNKIDLFIIDDADLIVKQGMQLPVAELANSITKCQHLVFTEVMHQKLEKMIAPFMKLPAVIEVEEMDESSLETYEQVLYIVPNFRTKLNLLNLFMQDDELFTKAVVFVNRRITADIVYKNLKPYLKDAVAVLNPMFISDLEAFINDTSLRVLIIANENSEKSNLNGVPFLIHLELPDDKEIYVNRVIKTTGNEDTLAITFATDLELGVIKKIEQAIGKRLQSADLPDNLLIDTDRKDKDEATENKPAKADKNTAVPGAAFHEKKAANSKTYNYSSGTKAKMNNKRKHG